MNERLIKLPGVSGKTVLLTSFGNAKAYKDYCYYIWEYDWQGLKYGGNKALRLIPEYDWRNERGFDFECNPNTLPDSFWLERGFKSAVRSVIVFPNNETVKNTVASLLSFANEEDKLRFRLMYV